MNNTQKKDYCLNRIRDMELDAINDMNNYNSVVCSIGYISILAILTYVHDTMFYGLLCCTCVCYILSVAIFIAFEIKKVFINITYRENLIKLLKDFSQDKFNEETLNKLIAGTYVSCYEKFSNEQSTFFIPSVISGVLAGFLIVFNYILLFFIDLIIRICY